jgi:hypothetical protein
MGEAAINRHQTIVNRVLLQVMSFRSDGARGEPAGAI